MSTGARFAPGDWYAVVGDRVTVLLPGSQRGRVGGLWDLADSGAVADALLDALLGDGLSSIDHLALVAHGDDATRLIVRGAPTATVTSSAGQEIVSAPAGAAWAERLVTGVTTIRVALTGDGPAEHLLTPGIARVSVVDFGSPPATPDAPTPPTAQPSATGESPVVDEPWSDNDGQTRAGVPVPDFDRVPVPGQERAPDVVSRPIASLVFSTGDVVAVDRTVLVGRAPAARRFGSHDQSHVVTVASPQQEISSTHLEIRPGAGADHGSAIVTDLGSTNGTVLAQPGLEPEELKAGIAVSLIPGAVLDLGDGVTIQVTDP